MVLLGIGVSPSAAHGARSAVRLTGVWQVGPVLDPDRSGRPPATGVSDFLITSDLPGPGEKVTTRGGQVCATDSCRTFRWEAMSVADAVRTSKMSAAIKLRPGAPAYAIIEDGKTNAVVVQRADGHLLFPIPLCDAHDENCRAGYLDWAPASADARLGPTRR